MRGRIKEIKLKKLRKKEEGYLIGIFLGDGYLYHDEKTRHYTLDFSLHKKKDRTVIKKLKEILEKKLKVKVFKIKENRCKSLKLRIHSKILSEHVLNKKKELFQKKHFRENYKIGIISGYIDAEGKIIGKRKIKIAGKKRFLGLIKKFGKSLGIKTSKIKKEKTRWVLILSEFKGIRHLSSKIRRSCRTH